MNPENNIILVIDDSVNNIKMIVDYLKESGFETAVARNGIIGLKRAELLKPAFILLDVMMPEMDGFETCRRLKANNATRDIPVIFMTALNSTEDKVKAFACGGVDYITKPAQREEVLARVNTHLKIRHQAMEIEAARQAAEHANKTKSQFMANMSHEIRTPMNAIINMARFLADTELNKVQQEYTETILASSGILLSVINDILDFSKIEAGKMDLEILDFSPREMIGEVVRIFSLKVNQKGLSLTHQIAPDVPSYLRGDPVRLRQIILNYLNNAVKFTEKGEVAIHVYLKKEKGSCVMLCCSVTDTGTGIPADRLDHLFQPFSQADVSTTRKFGGTGLGLAISKQLSEMMGGEAGAESEEGVGSTFWFTATLEKSDIATESLKPESQNLKPYKDPSQVPSFKFQISNLRFLLVEDNLFNQKVGLTMLKKFGFQADVADNGRDAVKILETNDYDLVLMDIQMPYMDGFEATKIIRDPDSKVRNHNIPIIAMTAYAMKDDRDRCIEAGMDDYVSKPLEPEEFFKTIQKRLPVISEYQHISPHSHIQRGSFRSAEHITTATGDKESVIEETKVFDREEFLHRWRLDEAHCKEMLEMFPEYLLEEIETLKADLNENKSEKAEIHAHTIKGMAANISAHRLRDVAQRTEDAAKKGNPDEARLFAGKLEQEAEKLLSLLRNFGFSDTLAIPPLPSSLTPEVTESLTPAAFAALPHELLAELKNAVTRINLEMIYTVIGKICAYNPKLAGALTALVDDFNYLKILNLIKKTE